MALRAAGPGVVVSRTTPRTTAWCLESCTLAFSVRTLRPLRYRGRPTPPQLEQTPTYLCSSALVMSHMAASLPWRGIHAHIVNKEWRRRGLVGHRVARQPPSDGRVEDEEEGLVKWPGANRKLLLEYLRVHA